jgi:hypothetical protein
VHPCAALASKGCGAWALWSWHRYKQDLTSLWWSSKINCLKSRNLSIIFVSMKTSSRHSGGQILNYRLWNHLVFIFSIFILKYFSLDCLRCVQLIFVKFKKVQKESPQINLKLIYKISVKVVNFNLFIVVILVFFKFRFFILVFAC